MEKIELRQGTYMSNIFSKPLNYYDGVHDTFMVIRELEKLGKDTIEDIFSNIDISNDEYIIDIFEKLYYKYSLSDIAYKLNEYYEKKDIEVGDEVKHYNPYISGDEIFIVTHVYENDIEGFRIGKAGNGSPIRTTIKKCTKTGKHYDCIKCLIGDK